MFKSYQFALQNYENHFNSHGNGTGVFLFVTILYYLCHKYLTKTVTIEELSGHIRATFGFVPTCELPEVEFNEEKDIAKVPGVKGQSYVTCTPTMFAMFFPQDGHAPCICEKAELKKAIFKVKV